MYQLNIHKPMKHDGNHPRVLKKPAEVMAGPFLIIYQSSWEAGRVPAGWQLVSVIPAERKRMKKDPE